MTSAIINQMAWTNEKFRLSCLDNTGLKRALLKMIIVDNNTSTKSNNKKNVSTKLCYSQELNHIRLVQVEDKTRHSGTHLDYIFFLCGIPSSSFAMQDSGVLFGYFLYHSVPVYLSNCLFNLSPFWYYSFSNIYFLEISVCDLNW